MMLQVEDVQTLTGFGLTFLQSKVYLTLVKSGSSSTVKKIAERTNMARQEAQRVVGELQSIGLVEKLLVNPTEFKPVPISDGVRFLINRRENASLELQLKANILLRNFESRGQEIKEKETEPNQFIIISGKEAIIRKSRMIVDRTEESCNIIGGLWKNVGYSGSLFKEQTTQALKRHVKIRIVAEKVPDIQAVQKTYEHCIENPDFEIRFVSTSISAMLGIYDRRELLVNTSTEKRLGDSPMLWTNNPALVAVAQTYFDKIWNQEASLFNHYSGNVIIA